MPITHGVAAAVSETLYSLKEPCQFLTHLAQSCANTDGKTGDELNDAVGEASQIIRGILGKPEHIFYVTFDDIAAAGAWGVSDVKYKMTELSHSMTLHPNFVSGYNILTRPATRHATAKEDATRAQQGALALPPVLKPAALRGALQISLQTVFSHELTHLFGALITGGETPDDVKARGYVPSAVGPKGERGTRFEELHLGGRLGAYFRTGREMDWAACCGLYLSKWSEETKKDERWTLASNLLNAIPYQFKNLDPQGMERFIEPEDSPHARIISKFHSQGDITTVDLTQDEDEAAEVRLERLVALGGVLDASLFS